MFVQYTLFLLENGDDDEPTHFNIHTAHGMMMVVNGVKNATSHKFTTAFSPYTPPPANI